MIVRLEKLSWISCGRSGRKKKIFYKNLALILLGTFLLMLITLWVLSSYTKWILHKEFDPTQDKMVKSWLPSLSNHFIPNFPEVINNNIAAATNILLAPSPPEQVSFPTIRISVENNGFEILNNKIFLYSLGFLEKKPIIKGSYQTHEGPTLPISVNLRGVMAYHHMVWKPSLRIKFKRINLVEGHRNHLLISPEDGIGIRNWLSNKLSNQWGLMDIGDHFVRLFVNNKYMGIYNRMWRFDESLFIQSNRVPGYIFKLEHLDKREFMMVWKSWDKIDAWKKIGDDANRGETILSRILETVKIIYSWNVEQGRPELARRLMELDEMIDRDTFAKYLALLCHSGETHIDDKHNNTFWLDPVSGKLKPILEDVNGYDFPTRTKKQLLRPITKNQAAFVKIWLQNPNNFELYIRHLIELIDTFGSGNALETLIRKKWKTIRSSAFSDLHISQLRGNSKNLIPVTILDQNVESLINFIRKRNLWIKNRLNNVKISVVHSSQKNFEVYIESFIPIQVKKKNGDPFILQGATRSDSFWKLKTSKNTVLNHELRTLYKPPEFYSFYKFSGQPQDYSFTHLRSKDELIFSPPPKHLQFLRVAAGLNYLEIPSPDKTPVILGPGEIIIDQTHEYNVNQPVKILPGTQLKLGPDVSLIFRGPLQVEGTANQPVIIRPIDSEKPFGVFALLGKETQRSLIRYLDIEGGSIHQRYNLKFTGMFSVHDCPDIEVINSRFGQNFIGDDAVHFMRSKVRIKSSLFENAFFDAMDWDQVDGEIINSRFVNSGNDGLDLSMGTVNVVNSLFERSGDKCVSAGEGTKVTIVDSNFRHCKIGIAVKDRSRVKLTNNLFSRNNIAYYTYRKKWRWERGGEGFIRNTRFFESVQADIKGDKFSKVSFIGALPKNIQIQGKPQLVSYYKK